MTSRHIFNFAKGISNLLILCALFTVPFIVNAEQGKDSVPATTQKTQEVEIYDPYTAYLEEDKALNISYKMLSESLDKNSLPVLKQSQRKWIKWRDTTCYSAQEKANRQIGAVGSSVRNDCLLTLTEQRNIELRQFIEAPHEAAKMKFDFDRKNEYLDN